MGEESVSEGTRAAWGMCNTKISGDLVN